MNQSLAVTVTCTSCPGHGSDWLWSASEVATFSLLSAWCPHPTPFACVVHVSLIPGTLSVSEFIAAQLRLCMYPRRGYMVCVEFAASAWALPAATRWVRIFAS